MTAPKVITVHCVQRRKSASVIFSSTRRDSVVPVNASTTQLSARKIDSEFCISPLDAALREYGHATEVDDFHQVPKRLCESLGRHYALTIQARADKKNVEQRTGHAGHQLYGAANEPAQHGLAPAVDVQVQAFRQYETDERGEANRM